MDFSINTHHHPNQANDGITFIVVAFLWAISTLAKWMPFVEGVSHWILWSIQMVAGITSIIIGFKTIKSWFDKKDKNGKSNI